MQQSIAKLGKEITTLKASLAQANRSAHSQIAKISERLEHQPAEITGSITAPKTKARGNAVAGAAPGATLGRGRTAAARARAGDGGLVHPRRPQRLRLRRGSRRNLSGQLGAPAARPRTGAIGQAAGWALDGADAEGHHRVACATGPISKKSDGQRAIEPAAPANKGAAACDLCVDP